MKTAEKIRSRSTSSGFRGSGKNSLQSPPASMFSKGFCDGDSARTIRLEPFTRMTSAFRPPSPQISRYPTTTMVTTRGRESGAAKREAGLEVADIGCTTSIGFEPEAKPLANLPMIQFGAPEDGLEHRRLGTLGPVVESVSRIAVLSPS
jgi:hypothetical protein